MKRVLATAVCLGLVSIASPADAAIKPVRYKNCAALNKVYKHGVARDKVARDKAKKPVKGYVVNKKVYVLNVTKDKDKDGIVCEKK